MYPSAIIFSSYQKSIHLLVNKLVSKGVKVFVVDPTDSFDKWNINNFLFKAVKSVSQVSETPSYIFVILNTHIDDIYTSSFAYINNSFVKTIVSLPANETKYDESLRGLFFKNERIVKIVRFGEVIGESEFINNFLFSLKKEKQYVVSELTKTLPVISIDEYCDELLKEAFSYGTSTEFGIAHFLNIEDIVKDLQKVDSNIFVYKKSDGNPLPFFSEKINLHKPSSQQTPSLAYLFSQINIAEPILNNSKIENKNSSNNNNVKKTDKNKSLASRIFGAFFASIILFLTPYLLLFASFVLISTSFVFYEKNNLKAFSMALSVAGKTALISEKMFYVPSSVSFVSSFFTPSYDLALSFSQVSKISNLTQNLNKEKDNYQAGLESLNFQIATKSLNEIYINSSELSNNIQLVNSSLKKYEKIPQINNLISNFSNLQVVSYWVLNMSHDASSVLGFDYKKTYLIFVNDHEDFLILDVQNGKKVGEELYSFSEMDKLFSGKFVDGEEISIFDILQTKDFDLLSKKLSRLVDLSLDRKLDGVIKLNKDLYENIYKMSNLFELAKLLSNQNNYLVYLENKQSLSAVLGEQAINGEQVSFEIEENNIGGNNANIAVTKKIGLSLYLGDKYIKNKLVYELKNNNKITSNIPESRYKAEVNVNINETKLSLFDIVIEYYENGIVKKKIIAPNTIKFNDYTKLSFEIDLNPSVLARIYIQWQEEKNTIFDNILLKINSNFEVNENDFQIKAFYDNLTKQEIYSYNTALSRELSHLIEIK